MEDGGVQLAICTKIKPVLLCFQTCEECGYFAIRKAIGNVLYTIDSSEGTCLIWQG